MSLSRPGEPAVVVIVLGMVVGACAPAAASISPSPASPLPQPTSTSVPTPGIFAGIDTLQCGYPSAGSSASSAPGLAATLPHQVPELEARLPAVVAGDRMVAWSARGETLFAILAALDHADLAFLASLQFLDAAVSSDGFGFAMEGTESPCQMLAVFALPSALLPPMAPSQQLSRLYETVLRMIESLGDLSVQINGAYFPQKRVGGKLIFLGKPEMVASASYGNARHYCYQKGPPGRELFVVLTADEAWAADALRQFPQPHDP